MPAPPDDARSQRATVVSTERLGEDACLLRVRLETSLGAIRASRFFMLRREDDLSPAIPRPFSIYRQDGDELEFLLKIMGRGTRALSDSRPGERVRLIGPLGNGWPTLDGAGEPWVMLAGGVGCAPFYMAIEQAMAGMDGQTPAAPDQLTYLFGAASAGYLYDSERLATLGARFEAATDDGSAGYHGNVLGLLKELWSKGELPERVRLLACGPEPMLAAVADLAEERQLDCWLSLETLMGCGVGICNGCPVPTRPEGEHGDWPNVKCCVEGPVFKSSNILVH